MTKTRSAYGLAVFGLLALLVCPAMAQTGSAAVKPPPMGWNSWNWFAKANINEGVVREVIEAMATNGLKDAGYSYVVVDGGWRDTKLGANGELLAHPQKFPGGMKALADLAHSKGLKFGLHTVPGTRDCGGDKVGGFGHETVQVKQFVDWGIDFVKLDRCRFNVDDVTTNDIAWQAEMAGQTAKGLGGWSEELIKQTYTLWSQLLKDSGRDIFYNISAYAYRDWYPSTCDMARTTLDIRCRIHGGANFDGGALSVMGIAEANRKHADAAGRGYWNDPDMLVVGGHGLTPAEQKTHFALWCVMTAPLMLGNDPRNMSPEERDIVLNKEAIAVDQDITEQGRRMSKDGDAEVWVKKLAGGKRAVLLLNRNANETKPVTVVWKDLGFMGKVSVRDTFGKKDLGESQGSLTKETAPHDCWLLVVSNNSRAVVPMAAPTGISEPGLSGHGWKTTFAPDGTLKVMSADFGDGRLQSVPVRHDQYSGPAWYFRTAGTNKVTRPKLAATAERLAFEGAEAGIHFRLAYGTNMDGALSVVASISNATQQVWQPDTAGLKVGLDCWMEKYPEWNHRFVPTMLRCEKTHFWGYAMMPDGCIMGIASPDPVAAWSIDYVGDHRIATFSVDLLNALPLPARHPQTLTSLAPGESRNWRLVMSPIAKQEDVCAWVAKVTDAPMFDIDRFTIAPGETANGTVVGGRVKSLTLTNPDGNTSRIRPTRPAGGVEEFSMSPKTPGLYTVRAESASGMTSEATVCVRRPLAWYLSRARLEGLRVKPTATHHAECVYPFYSYFLAREWLPDPKVDAECEAVFQELFPHHYDEQKGELRTSWRIQDTATWAGILADRYAVTHAEEDLEHAAALCDFLINKHQGEDGGFYRTVDFGGTKALKNSVYYTSVIYLAKSIMEVMAEEKKLATADPKWRVRYERHHAAVTRAIDDLARRRDNVETEGEQTFEDGMISCSIAQLAMYALKLDPGESVQPYLDSALDLYSKHRSLTMTGSPDARVNGSTIRYWETKYTICVMANMNNSPCGWSAWKLYADNYLYQLTGDERYLREYFNGLGACLQVIDTESGRMRWGFTPNPYVRSRYPVPGPDGTDTGWHWTNGVFGEQYLEQISDWNRTQPIWRQKWGIDNFTHEILKCMTEGALAEVYLLERPDGTLACYNGTVETKNVVAVITPTETQACRLHVNLRNPARIRIRLDGQMVEGTFEGRRWVGPGGVPPDLRMF